MCENKKEEEGRGLCMYVCFSTGRCKIHGLTKRTIVCRNLLHQYNLKNTIWLKGLFYSLRITMSITIVSIFYIFVRIMFNPCILEPSIFQMHKNSHSTHRSKWNFKTFYVTHIMCTYKFFMSCERDRKKGSLTDTYSYQYIL